jgi:ubiquinone/menaquinone biosynthesis C-methylase UbiE
VKLEQWREHWDGRSGVEDPIAAAGYVLAGSPLPAALFEALAEDIAAKLRLAAGVSLLEVGCGPGLLAERLAPPVQRCAGVDLAPGMVDRARVPCPGLEFRLAPAHEILWRDGTFDRVLMYGALHCSPSHHHARCAVREMKRVTRPGGLVLVADVSAAGVPRRGAWASAPERGHPGRRWRSFSRS